MVETSELGATVATTANVAATVVGEKIGSLASVIRDKAPHEGAVATAATAVVEGSNRRARICARTSSTIWQETSRPWSDLPVQSLLIGVGLGPCDGAAHEIRHGKGSQRLRTSFTSLVGDLASDANELLRQEVALAKLEVQYELRKAKKVAMALGVGIGVPILGGILLMLMVVHLLAALTVVPLWGCYGIVGSALVVLGGVGLAVALATAKKLGVVPRERRRG
jgi:hypothetical protein